MRLAVATLVACLAALALAGCGDGAGEKGPTEVLIEADAGPLGSPALRGPDGASGPQNQRIAITKDGTPTPVYAVRLKDLEAGMRVGALATVTLTKCRITDYIPNARGFTACEGTKVYDFSPVSISSSFRLVGGSGKPDLSGPGTTIGDSLDTSCTTAIHHCTLSQEAFDELSDADVPGGGSGWLVYEVAAKSPKARACGSDPRRCNVLAVETQKGTAMYAVRAKGEPASSDSLPEDTSRNTEELDVLIDRGDKNTARNVVYSVPLGSASDLKSLEGDQMVVQAKLAIEEKLPQAPDIANYLVLSDSPTSIRGRYLLSDSYDPNKTGNNGENCEGSCEFIRPAAVTTILRCDVEAGRRFVNLVADGSRADAKRGEHVTVAEGGYLKVSEYFDADVTSDAQSVDNCNR